MKKLLLVAVFAALVAIPTASAHKPPPPPPPSTATLAFSPNPVYEYGIFAVTGCGYPRSTALTLVFEDSASPYPYEYFGAYADTSGCLVYPPPYTGTLSFQVDGGPGSTVEISIWHGVTMLADAVESVVAYP
jgi:hypothetical protein